MYEVFYSGQFRRDVKLCRKRGLDLSLLAHVVDLLRADGVLPPEYRQHRLSGKYSRYWEAHIQADWLVVWQQDDTRLTLLFTKTGTHSDIF
jgi:mRNA interferase YafQ